MAPTKKNPPAQSGPPPRQPTPPAPLCRFEELANRENRLRKDAAARRDKGDE
jgi:hypothetical protein